VYTLREELLHRGYGDCWKTSGLPNDATEKHVPDKREHGLHYGKINSSGFWVISSYIHGPE
jgi:hypothetical protein